ncbi:MAG: hypothetical protein K2R98_13975 [Gemmataceae bacterium]|nr:hypothetical protein [Gemmataceae bacterium]
MEAIPEFCREAFLDAMREKMEATFRQVADAVNAAPAGYLIAGSEEKVRDLFANLRHQAFEVSLQMRVNAAEAAFPPSEAPPNRQEPSQ